MSASSSVFGVSHFESTTSVEVVAPCARCGQPSESLVGTSPFDGVRRAQRTQARSAAGGARSSSRLASPGDCIDAAADPGRCHGSHERWRRPLKQRCRSRHPSSCPHLREIHALSGRAGRSGEDRFADVRRGRRTPRDSALPRPTSCGAPLPGSIRHDWSSRSPLASGPCGAFLRAAPGSPRPRPMKNSKRRAASWSGVVDLVRKQQARLWARRRNRRQLLVARRDPRRAGRCRRRTVNQVGPSANRGVRLLDDDRRDRASGLRWSPGRRCRSGRKRLRSSRRSLPGGRRVTTGVSCTTGQPRSSAQGRPVTSVGDLPTFGKNRPRRPCLPMGAPRVPHEAPSFCSVSERIHARLRTGKRARVRPARGPETLDRGHRCYFGRISNRFFRGR